MATLCRGHTKARVGYRSIWSTTPHRHHRRLKHIRLISASDRFVQPVDKLQELLVYLQNAQSSVDLQKRLMQEIKTLCRQRAASLAELLCSSNSSSEAPSMLHSTARQLMLQELAGILWDTRTVGSEGKPSAVLDDAQARTAILAEVRRCLPPSEQVVLYAPALELSHLEASELIAAACVHLAAGYCGCSVQYVSTADSLLLRASLMQALGDGRKLSGNWQSVDVAMARAVCAILLGRLGEAQLLLRDCGRGVGGYKQGIWPGLQAATEMYMMAERWLEQYIVAMFPVEQLANPQTHQQNHATELQRMEDWLKSTPLLERSTQGGTPIQNVLHNLRSMPWVLWSLAAVAVSSFLAVVPGAHHLPAGSWRLPQAGCFTMRSYLQASASGVEAQAGVRVLFAYENGDQNDELSRDSKEQPSSSPQSNVPEPADHEGHQKPIFPPPPAPPKLTKAAATNLLRRYQSTKSVAWSHGYGGQMVAQTCEGRELHHLLQWIKEDKRSGVHRVITPTSIKVESVENPEPSCAVVKAFLEEHHSTVDLGTQPDGADFYVESGGDRSQAAASRISGQKSTLSNLPTPPPRGQKVESMRSFHMSSMVQCVMVHTIDGWKVSNILATSSNIKML